MPRLNHKKTRSGCQRCKDRKVKCDEGRPRCRACARHNVPCEYPRGSSTKPEIQPSVTPSTDVPYHGPPENNATLDSVRELRLMHEWTAYTCKTFTTTWEFWCYQAPLIALEFRYLLDAMFAMAALHASRQPPSQWIPIEGRVLPIANQTNDSSYPLAHWKQLRRKSVMDRVVSGLKDTEDDAYLGAKRIDGMLTASRMYFDRAMDGYRQAVNNITKDNIEAVFTTSILISFNALFALSESGDSTMVPSLDPCFWLRLGRGNYHIIQQWHKLAGDSWIAKSGVFYGEPDLTDDDWIFSPEHQKPFERLLTFAAEFEAISDEDRYAYTRTLSYIGTIYKGIVDGTDRPMGTCRRFVAMPSKCPPRFVDLVEAKQPRAMVMLAHAFASLKLVDDIEWFPGIAEHQVPQIYDQVPLGWREMMAWPMACARGEITTPGKDT